MTAKIGLLRFSVLAAGTFVSAQAGPAVNPHSAVIQDYEKRIASYVELRGKVESKLPSLKATPSQDKIEQHESELAHAIREARGAARQGDIFRPDIAAEIRRLVRMAMRPGHGKRIQDSLNSAEPVQVQVRVNEQYPGKVPLQSMPPSLLMNLPPLPAGLEYRLAGHDLILLDTKPNLVVDLINNVSH
jgi:hypothetical protein